MVLYIYVHIKIDGIVVKSYTGRLVAAVYSIINIQNI